MNLLTRFGLARSRFTIAVMIGLLVAGIGLYPNFPKREDPVIVIRTAVVSALFPGMAPERMENLVAVPIERKIRELAEVKDIRTLAGEGSLTIYVDLKDEIGNVNATWQRLRDKMGDVKVELPDGVVGPFVNSDFGDVAIATIAITGEGFSQREMKDVAEDFRKKLYQLSGISKVELLGVQDERVWLELDTRKLAAVGVQVNSLIKDLQGQNVVLPSGNINADGTRLLLETSGDFPNVRAIETMLTRVGTTDSLVRLADLVTVRRDYVSPKVKPIYFNGRPAVVLSVVMQPDQDVTQLGGKLRAAAREYEGRLPIGYAIDFATYQADQVSASVNSALSSVAQTFIVVAVLVVLFLGLRAGTVAAMIVPFAVMFSLIGMRALGIALEQVSIAAIIIALGLLVDNGVVIVEDIVSRIGRGVAPQEAGLASGEQYALPLLISSVTTIAAFLPLLLLSGSSGEYAFSLAAVVALTLGGSWITALYILPALTVWLIGRRSASSREDAAPSRIQRFYASALGPALRFSPFVLAACIVLVVLALTQFARLPKQMFPLSERSQFLVYMNMPDGTDISQTELRAREIERWLGDKAANPEIASEILYVGDGGPRFYLTLTPVSPDPASAFFLINTKDYEGAVRAADRAWKYLYANHPEARFKIKRLAMGAVESGIVDVEISGPDGDRLLALSERVRSLLQAAPDVRDNDDDWGNKIVKVVVEIDQDRARQLGVTSEEVTQLLNTYFSGTAVSIYREGDNAIPIVLRAGAYTSQSLEGLTSATFAKNGGADFPGAGRQVEARIRSGAHPPQEPGADDHGHRPQHLADGRAVAGIDPAWPAGAGPCRSISRHYRRRDPEERGDQPETGCGIPHRACRHGAGDHPAVQLVPSHVSDLHEHTVDPDRHPLRPLGGGTAALVLRHARHHQSFRHHHQQCHRADRSDRYRAGEAPAARSGRGRVGKALASDPADIGNDGAWTGTYGDCRRRVVAADGGAHDVGACCRFAADAVLRSSRILPAVLVR